MQPRTLSGSGGDLARVKELETQLLETRMLYTTTLDDFKLVSWTIELDLSYPHSQVLKGRLGTRLDLSARLQGRVVLKYVMCLAPPYSGGSHSRQRRRRDCPEGTVPQEGNPQPGSRLCNEGSGKLLPDTDTHAGAEAV